MDDLSDTIWRLLEPSGHIICHHLSLLPDGRIGGHASPTERGWRPHGDGIAFLDEDDRPTGILRPDRAGRLVPAAAGDAPTSRPLVLSRPEIEYPLGVRWNRECEDALAAIPIFARHFRSVHDAHRWGDLVWFERPCLVERDATMPRGRFCSMGAHSYCDREFDGDLTVGRYSSIAKLCGIMGDRHPTDWVTTSHITYHGPFSAISADLYGKPFHPFPRTVKQPPIEIGNDVWIGQDVLFKGGVRIGDGAVVGARALVTRDVEPYAIVGGVPARTIRMRFEPALVRRMQTIRWWRFNYPDLPACWDEPHRFLDELEEMIRRGTIVERPDRPIDLGHLILRASLGLSTAGFGGT